MHPLTWHHRRPANSRRRVAFSFREQRELGRSGSQAIDFQNAVEPDFCTVIETQPFLTTARDDVRNHRPAPPHRSLFIAPDEITASTAHRPKFDFIMQGAVDRAV